MAREYRIVAKIKNNRLWSAIQRRWPDVQTQSDASRRLDVSPSDLGRLLNMQIWPFSDNRRRSGWWPIAHKIADALYQDPEFLFDGILYGQPPKHVDLVVDREALEIHGLIPSQDDPLTRLELHEQADTFHEVLATLSPREEAVIKYRFGLEDGIERTLSEVGGFFDLGAERIRQIEGRALQKMRHPLRANRLKGQVEILPMVKPAQSAPERKRNVGPVCLGSGQKARSVRGGEGVCPHCPRQRVRVRMNRKLYAHRVMTPERAAKYEGREYYAP